VLGAGLGALLGPVVGASRPAPVSQDSAPRRPGAGGGATLLV